MEYDCAGLANVVPQAYGIPLPQAYPIILRRPVQSDSANVLIRFRFLLHLLHFLGFADLRATLKLRVPAIFVNQPANAFVQSLGLQ